MVSSLNPPDGGRGHHQPLDQPPPIVEIPRDKGAPRKPRRKRIFQPAKNSLYDLMHENAGVQLFQRPIFWTDLHLKVLGARFAELPPCDQQLPLDVPGTPPSKGHMRPSENIRKLSNALTELLMPGTQHPVMSSNAIRRVLCTLWPESFREARVLPELHLYFDGRIYRETVRAQVMWNFPSDIPGTTQNSFETISTLIAPECSGAPPSSAVSHNPSGLPMVCFIGKNQLETIRKNLYRVATGPGNTPNKPVQRLQQLRSMMLMPSNSDHDPFLPGLFLAMAQRHFYNLPGAPLRPIAPWRPPREVLKRPAFQDVKLRILTHDVETSEFIVYTAVVTAKFLDRFHDPFGVPLGAEESETPSMDIQYTRVPIWPILGLRERIGTALGHDVVGYFSPDEFETWEEQEEEHADTTPEIITAGKRKRNSINGVLANAFNDDEDDAEVDEPALSAKKRCLSEGSPVGVVV